MSTTNTRPRNSWVEYATTPPPPRRELTVMLMLASLLALVSMPLAWHQHELPTGGYKVVHGIEGANWLLVIAVIATASAVRFYSQPTGFYSMWLLTIAAFAATLGTFAEYVDTQSHAGQLHVDRYFGPGFYVGVIAAGVLVASAVLAWRGAESL